MEEKEHRCWGNQPSLSTSSGLKLPIKNGQEIYEALKKSWRKMGRKDQLWLRVSSSGGRWLGH